LRTATVIFHGENSTFKSRKSLCSSYLSDSLLGKSVSSCLRILSGDPCLSCEWLETDFFIRQDLNSLMTCLGFYVTRPWHILCCFLSFLPRFRSRCLLFCSLPVLRYYSLCVVFARTLSLMQNVGYRMRTKIQSRRPGHTRTKHRHWVPVATRGPQELV